MADLKQLEQDYKTALRSGDKFTVEVLRGLKGALHNVEIEKRGKGGGQSAELSDEEELAVVKRQVKQLEEAKELFAKGGRTDLVEQNEKEIVVLKKYLPAQMSEDQVRAVVEKVVAGIGKVGAGDFGKVMGAVMKELRGGADGALVGKLVKEALGS